MKLFFALVAILALCSIVKGQLWGKVRIISANGYSGIHGNATFSTSGITTSITIEVEGIPSTLPRSLAIHINQFADMATLAGVDSFQFGNKTFGTAWIGTGNATFGCPETNQSPGYRSGLLGNWNVSESGTISQTKTFNWIQISSGNAAFDDITYPQSSPIGRGLVIRARTDPCNGTSAMYGPVIAGGVIGMVSTAPATARAYVSPVVNTITAICRLEGTKSNSSYAPIRGTVWFRQTNIQETHVRARITGVPGGLGPEGARSMHVHSWGDLTDQLTALSTGGHWNPLGAPHALPLQEPRHQGDLGRLTVINPTTNEIFYHSVLRSSSVASILNINHPQLSHEYSVVGRGLVLRAGQDVGCRAPVASGNAGSRLAQCVIGFARDEVWDEMVADWSINAPVEARNPIAQPGDICTPPSTPPDANGPAGPTPTSPPVEQYILPPIFFTPRPPPPPVAPLPPTQAAPSAKSSISSAALLKSTSLVAILFSVILFMIA